MEMILHLDLTQENIGIENTGEALITRLWVSLISVVRADFVIRDE